MVASGGRSYVYFKFEPFVLHVICRTLQDAQMMVNSGTGFELKESLGREGELAYQNPVLLLKKLCFPYTILVL